MDASGDTRVCFESLEEGVAWIGRTYKEACDAAAPRVGKISERKQAYWWSDRISALRAEIIKAQRKWTRAKRRNATTEEEERRLSRSYTRARRVLQ